jgi:2-dehydro-3-deoxyphosphogluconate aldolase/(4S)-4-hydroxy-2-oxoglutarate aldolase
MEQLTQNQSIIITLDVDVLLFDRLAELIKAHFLVVEINSIDSNTLTSVLHHFPMLRVGAGNILTTQQLEDSYTAGAHFATSPGFLPAIAQTADLYSMNYIPGVATLSEAMHAMSFGCKNVKPFPAKLDFCALLNKYLPLLRLFPAEIEGEEIEHFLSLPAVAAVSIINPDYKQLQSLSTALTMS